MALPAILLGLGRALGGAAEIGGMTGASSKLVQGLSGASEMANKFGGAMQMVKSGVDQVGHAFKAIAMFIPNQILQMKQEIVQTFQTFAAALSAPIDAIKEMGDSLGKFVRLSSPATFQRFTFAVENTFATIGKFLEPIMDRLTDAANRMGDVFAKLEPAFAPAITAVEKLIDVGMDRFALIMENAAPLIERGSIALLGLAKVVQTLESVTRPLIRAFGFIQRQINGIFGIGNGFDPSKRQGVAVRDTHFASAEELQREVAQAAVKASLGGKNRRDMTDEAILSVPDILRNILASINNLPRTVREAIFQMLKDAIPMIVDEIKKAPTEIREAANEARRDPVKTGIHFLGPGPTAAAEMVHLIR